MWGDSGAHHTTVPLRLKIKKALWLAAFTYKHLVYFFFIFWDVNTSDLSCANSCWTKVLKGLFHPANVHLLSGQTLHIWTCKVEWYIMHHIRQTLLPIRLLQWCVESTSFPLSSCGMQTCCAHWFKAETLCFFFFFFWVSKGHWVKVLSCSVFQREEQHEPIQRLYVCILCIFLNMLDTAKRAAKNRSQNERF